MYIVTHPVTAEVLLRGQLAFMRRHGFDVTVVSSPGPDLDRVRDREGVHVIEVPMARQPDPRADPGSLARLVGVMRRVRPDIVNASTPKAGLLGMLAARAVNVPIRLYLLRGLRLETATGVTRTILSVTERVAAACAADVLCVSPSLLARAVEGGYIPATKASVVGQGSSNGFDTDRFRRTPELRDEGQRLLGAVGIQPSDPIVGFVGRLAADKGISELLDAFAIVRGQRPNVKLALLGGDLADELADEALVARIGRTSNVVVTPRVADPAPYYARIDVLAFPSYREGFPNVVAEASSAELPVVGFRSTGVVDAIVDGETGALVGSRDPKALATEILRYLSDPQRAAQHGAAARRRVVANWSNQAVWEAWLATYRARLAARRLPLPDH